MMRVVCVVLFDNVVLFQSKVKASDVNGESLDRW